MDLRETEKEALQKAVNKNVKFAQYAGISLQGGFVRLMLYWAMNSFFYLRTFSFLMQRDQTLYFILYVAVAYIAPIGLVYLEASTCRKANRAYHVCKRKLEAVVEQEIKERHRLLLEHSQEESALIKLMAAEYWKDPDGRDWTKLEAACADFVREWTGKGVNEMRVCEILRKYMSDAY
ncbi:MAG: hypothetical protein LBK56_07975 [Gracilibacteraceae bacterium]|jgi:hypothetical protein|nr:hypothetical protein [Gracilibacteraceae bacterium]